MIRCRLLLVAAALTLLGSCASLSFDTSESASWAAADSGKVRGSIRIISVSAERSGEWGTLEKEITDLLPLLFMEEGYLTVSPSGLSDYAAEVTVREREYPDGWQTKRSLSAEVRLWAGEGKDPACLPLPLSAGRALNNGKQSFASSKTLSAMLRKAVKNAVAGLPPKGGTASGTLPVREEAVR
ncbi:MAG: hypothetical protein FWC45_00225 [Treponema sp.]|nr:hypothetical protein [Treponema sp.]